MKNDPKKKALACKSRRVYGVRVVQEYLREHPELILNLYLLSSGSGRNEIERRAQELMLPLHYADERLFSTLVPEGGHQGVVADLVPFSYSSLSEILRPTNNFLLVLDEIMDPRNLGALLRTAEAAGVDGVLLTKDRSAPLSATTEKTASGAAAHLSIGRIENLARALDAMRTAGFWTVGLAPDARQSLYNLDLPEKVALVLGGEGKGLRVLSRQHCDFLVSLPMCGKIQSLNVSVAGAVALYEVVRRRLQRRNFPSLPERRDP